MKALLIIDMQKVSFTSDTPRYRSEQVIQYINNLADSFRNSGDLVIFIQHDGSKQDFCKPRTEEWELLDELVRKKNDIIVSKTANDSFYMTELDNLLKQKIIKEIVITGCATDFCVDSTVKSALTKDYKITVIADAHTTADRPGITAHLLIEHYNRVWSEMTPTGGRINVIPFSEFKK